MVFIVLFASFTSGRLAERFIDEPVSRFVALACAGVLSAFGRASAAARFVAFEDFAVVIVEACNGVLPTYIYLSAVLAFPSRWRAKAWGIAIGIPTIFVINILRVVTLLILGAHRPQLVNVIHVYVWQALVIAQAIAVWIFWVERFVRPRAGANP